MKSTDVDAMTTTSELKVRVASGPLAPLTPFRGVFVGCPPCISLAERSRARRTLKTLGSAAQGCRAIGPVADSDETRRLGGDGFRIGDPGASSFVCSPL